METEDEFGENPTLPGSDENYEQLELSRGTSIDRYLIVEPIGSGGMGAVYRAYDPKLNRGVALKILSVKQNELGAAERAKTRLIREAQALAQLSHPNVVAVHDYGSFGDDVFIAMELVEGKTLDEWMKAEKPAVKEKLEVMAAAGQGLSAAHKAGLVHRDFKPGNVIVGNDGRVRVLDFGLARASDEKLEEAPKEFENSLDGHELSSDSSPNLLQSPLTNVGGIVGTPLYMAPEQHLGHKTDERTDQFGFCVVLYEVLYGKRPFAAKTIKELKSVVIRNQVRIPPDDTGVPAWLWKIIHKGLSIKPDDRYETLESLLDDLEHDPEKVRRQRRLERRRKLFVISLIILIISLPISVWYGLRYKTFQLCKDAESEFDEVWDDATKTTVQQAFIRTEKSFAQSTWKRVHKLVDTYQANWMQMRSDVCEARLYHATQSEELFDLRMSCLQKRLTELRALVDVFIEADVQVVQKAVQASSSLADIAICADVDALRAPYPPPKRLEAKAKVATIRKKLAEVDAFQKTGKYKDGLVLMNKLEEEANAVDYRPVQAEVLYRFGGLLDLAGEYKKAETTLLAAARLAGESRDGLLTAKAMTQLVWVVGYKQARHEEGLSIAKYAKIVLEVAGGDKKVESEILNNLGGLFLNRGAYEKALEQYRKALIIRKQLLGRENPFVAGVLNNIGSLFVEQGEYDQALVFFRKSLAIKKKVLGNEHPGIAGSLSNMGNVLFGRGEYDKALEYYRKVLAINEKAFGRENPIVTDVLNNIGVVHARLGEHKKALEFHQEALAIRERALGPKHPSVGFSLDNIGRAFLHQKKYDKALECFRRAQAVLEKALGKANPLLAFPLSGIGVVYVDQNSPKKALDPLERAFRICEKKTCQPEPYALSLFGLARALLATGGDKNRAIKIAKQAREIFSKTPKTFNKERIDVSTWLEELGVD